MRTEPATEKGRETQQRLVNAAVKIFQRDGIFSARIADIAQEAGVSKAAYYRYFDSKDQILEVVVEEALRSIFDALGSTDPSERGLPILERFRLANRRYLESYRENALGFRLVEQHVATDLSFKRARRAAVGRFTPRLAGVLAQQMDHGLVDRFCDPVHLAESLGAMVDRTAYVNFVLRGVDELPAGVAETIDLLWSNLLGLEDPEGVELQRAIEPAQTQPHPPPSAEISDREVQTPKSLNTKRQLLEAARRVFERTGYLDGRVADIVAEAGVSHGTFYNYFVSRYDVFAAAAIEASVGLSEQLGGARSDPARSGQAPSLYERVVVDNIKAAEYYRQNSSFIAVFEQFAAVGRAEADIRLMVRDSFVARSARAVERMQANGEADPRLDPWLASDVLTCMFERTVINWYVLGLEEEFEHGIEDRIVALSLIWVRALGIREGSKKAEVDI
jgi:AcrR family transcriptional regulator